MSSFTKHYVSVHGFTRTSFDVLEGGRADILFQSNIKGTTQFTSLFVSGTITSAAEGTASEYVLYLVFNYCSVAVYKGKVCVLYKNIKENAVPPLRMGDIGMA